MDGQEQANAALSDTAAGGHAAIDGPPGRG